jgi:hypothetical protein
MGLPYPVERKADLLVLLLELPGWRATARGNRVTSAPGPYPGRGAGRGLVIGPPGSNALPEDA